MSQFLHPRDADSGSRSKSRPRQPRRESSTSSFGSVSKAVAGRFQDTYQYVRKSLSRSRSRDRREYEEGRADLPPPRQGLAKITPEMQKWRDNYVDWVPERDADLRRKEHKRRDREAREQRSRYERDREERFSAMGLPLRHHRSSHRNVYDDGSYNEAAPKRARARRADHSAEGTNVGVPGNPYPPGFYHDSRFPHFEERHLRTSEIPTIKPVLRPQPIDRLPNPADWEYSKQNHLRR